MLCIISESLQHPDDWTRLDDIGSVCHVGCLQSEICLTWEYQNGTYTSGYTSRRCVMCQLILKTPLERFSVKGYVHTWEQPFATTRQYASHSNNLLLSGLKCSRTGTHRRFPQMFDQHDAGCCITCCSPNKDYILSVFRRQLNAVSVGPRTHCNLTVSLHAYCRH